MKPKRRPRPAGNKPGNWGRAKPLIEQQQPVKGAPESAEEAEKKTREPTGRID